MNGTYLAALFVICMYSSSSAAQFCKWEDKDGVVHYAETCPKDVKGIVVKPHAQPSQEQVTDAARRSEQLQDRRSVSKAEHETLNAERESAAVQAQQTAENLEKDEWANLLKHPDQVDCGSLLASKSIQELDSLCERAKEKRLAPEREAKIRSCIQSGENDPERCESYWATYGDAGREGRLFRSQKYSSLPECVVARKCWDHLARH